MKLRILIKEGEYRLAKAGVMDAKIDAEELFCFMKKWDRVVLFLKKEEEVDQETEEEYFRLIDRRAERIPLQHITGVQEFMGYEFKVNGDVLIPRLDNETLVTDAAKTIMEEQKKYGAEHESKSFLGLFKSAPDYEVLDLCCGSGAIGISLALTCGNVAVTATDISDAAINLAVDNAKYHRAEVEFVKGDMFDALTTGDRITDTRGAKVSERKGKGKGAHTQKFNMIVTNPPYIKTNSIAMLQEEVKKHEPLMALDGGRDGLDYYRIIVDKAADFLKDEGWLMMEIGYDQGEVLRKMIMDSDKYTVAEILRDVPGKDRVIKCRRKKD